MKLSKIIYFHLDLLRKSRELPEWVNLIIFWEFWGLISYFCFGIGELWAHLLAGPILPFWYAWIWLGVQILGHPI